MVRFILLFLLLGLTGYVGAQEIKIEKSTEKIVYQGKSYYLHTVKAKETLFSICKAYGCLLYTSTGGYLTRLQPLS